MSHNTLITRLSMLIVVLSLVVFPYHSAAQDDLTATFTSADGRLTLNHPESWQVEESEPNWFVLGDPSVIGQNVGSGEVLIILATTPMVDDWMIQWGMDSTIGPNIVGNMISSLFGDAADGAGMEFITVGGRDAYLYPRTAPDGNDTLILAFEVESGAVLVMFSMTLPGERELARPIMLAIAETVQYTPPEKEPVGEIVWQQDFAIAPETPGGLGALRGLDVAPDGTVYIVDSLNTILVMSADGEQIDRLQPDVNDGSILTDVALADDGSLWVYEATTHTLLHLSADGSLLDTLGAGHDPLAPEDADSFARFTRGPDDGFTLIAWDAAAELYQIEVWDAVGAVLHLFTLGQLSQMPLTRLHVSPGPDGERLIVMDLTGQAVIFDLDGNLVHDYGFLVSAANAIALVVGPDGAINFATDAGELYRFDAQGEYVGDLTQRMPEGTEWNPGIYYHAGDIGLLPDGDVIVADNYQDTAQVVRYHFFGGPVAELAAGDAPSLTETFTSADGRFTASYPAGWFALDLGAGQAILYNDQEAFASRSYGPGEVFVQLQWFAFSDAGSQFAPTTAHTALGVAGELSSMFADSTPGAEFADPQPITIGEWAAAYFEGGSDDFAFRVIVLQPTEDMIVFLALGGYPVGLDMFEPLLRTIAESVIVQE